MNILVISHRVPYPPNKGEKIRTYHHIKFLTELGHNIIVLSPYEEESELLLFTGLSKDLGIEVHSSKLLRFRIFRLLKGFLLGQPLSVSNFFSRKALEKLERVLEEKSIDAVYCTASSMAEYVFSAKSLRKKAALPSVAAPKLIMDFMDLDSDKWHQYASKASWPKRFIFAREGRLLAFYEQRIVSQFDECIFSTEAEKELFTRLKPETGNIHAIENGLDNSFYHPIKIQQTVFPVVIFTGVMDYKPNIDAVEWFIENTWNKVQQRWPDARFIIAGMNPVQSVKNLKRYKGVEVTGFVDDIRTAYAQANVSIVPMRIARGIQNKVLQSFSCGLPVIASPMGAEGIRYQDNKNILIADSPDEYLNHLEKLFSDPSFYQGIRHEALKLVSDYYSWTSLLIPLGRLFDKN